MGDQGVLVNGMIRVTSLRRGGLELKFHGQESKYSEAKPRCTCFSPSELSSTYGPCYLKAGGVLTEQTKSVLEDISMILSFTLTLPLIYVETVI